jgi:hypothetical protein
MQKFSYQRIANTLDVTPDEAATISARIGKKFPAAACFASDHPFIPTEPVTSRRQRRIDRQKLISVILNDSPHQAVPSLRNLRAILQKKGIHVSHVTIRSDLAILGVQQGH